MKIEDIIPLVIVGLIAATRTAGFPAKFAPLLAIGLGIVAGLLVLPSMGDVSPARNVVMGLYMALSAVGLVSSTKNLVEGLGGGQK